MTAQKPVRLLILVESHNQAEELIVKLRNGGRATRAHKIESVSDLTSQLNHQNWDLLLGVKQIDDLTMKQVINVVSDLEKDIPIIMIADNQNPESITEGMRIGAVDVALVDDDERLIMIINRELRNLEDRRLRRHAEVELHEIDRRNHLLLATSTAAIAYVHEGMHIYTNTTYGELFGYDDPDDFAGIPIIDLIAQEDQSKFKSYLKSFPEHDATPVEFLCVASDGSKILSNLLISPASYDGEPCTQVMFKAALAESDMDNRLRETAHQDLLTGLYNRSYFEERLDAAVDQAREGNQSWILFYISIDKFAELRMIAGVSNTDLVLCDLAALIRQHTDEEHTLSRFGDDVFTMLYKNGDKQAARELAEEIRTTVEHHLSEVSDKALKLTISIGLSLISENAPPKEEIVSRAKKSSLEITGGNGVLFYEQPTIKVGTDGRSVTSATITELVRNAISTNSFKLLFQPIVSLHGEDEEQFEVLLRLLDEDENELIPAQFLGPAEEAGLLEKLDRWVILQSFKLLSVQRASGSKTKLFINITYRSMADSTFLPWISVALKAARLPSDAVIFQVHENDATSYIKEAVKFAKGMAQLHCKTSINHFGCSLKPFNLLKYLTPDYVKLDGSFAQGVENNSDKQKELLDMVKSLHATGVLTAISGVENPILLSTLWQAGINYIQGFYISPPLENMDYDFSSEDI